MSIKSPFTSKTERGAYSAIVRKEGDLIIAEDEVGSVIEEGSNAATVIQAAIDSCNNSGKVILADRFDTDAELTFPVLAYSSFASGITLQGYGNKTGLNYTPSTGYAIKLEGQSTVLPCAYTTLDNFLITAPNTVAGGIGVLGGAIKTTFRGMKIYNVPTGKGVYVTYNASYGNNTLFFYDVIMRDCKYGLYATGGPSISIKGGSLTTIATTGLEAFYYTVTGYTSDGFKQVHTTDLEIYSTPTGQRSLYILGDIFFFGSHRNLYDDVLRPMYFEGGRHAFKGCFLGPMTWSVGTQIEIDQTSRNMLLDTKDPMVTLAELQTPFRIDANSPFISHTGTGDVVDANAANGKCVELDAQGESLGMYYGYGASRMIKYLGVGTYLATVYVKDTNQVANDLKLYVQSSEGGTHLINITYHTLTASYTGIPYVFTLESADVGTTIVLFLRKNAAGANTISIDYITLQQVGTNFHQTVGGGHQFLYMPDGGTLPAASASFCGVIAFQPGAGSVADTMKMCMKSAADTYSWATVVTG